MCVDLSLPGSRWGFVFLNSSGSPRGESKLVSVLFEEETRMNNNKMKNMQNGNDSKVEKYTFWNPDGLRSGLG